jgi:hypothetical protein
MKPHLIPCIRKIRNKIKKTGGVGGVPPLLSIHFISKAFFVSVKPLKLAEEKD